jgi:hypothetical protein
VIRRCSYIWRRRRKGPAHLFPMDRGQSIGKLFRFMIFGEGDVAPLAHEALRRAIPEVEHRTIIHVS